MGNFNALFRTICMAFLLFQNYFGTESNDGLKNDITQQDNVQTSLSSWKEDNDDDETDVLTFTEKILAQWAGRNVNLKKLMMEFATICPLEDSCGVDIDKKFLLNRSIKSIFPECESCACSPYYLPGRTMYFCPGTYHGYVDYECISTTLYTTDSKSVFMVASCLEEYHSNTTLVEQCLSGIQPCTSTTSGLVYKNKYCGICNKEERCISWTIEVECHDHPFTGNVAESSTSLSEIKDFINKYNCRINFRPPDSVYSEVIDCNLHYKSDKSYTNKCNVTGLWHTYDADIEWACEKLFLPYKDFKNAFCYICNPSIGSIQNVALINKCKNSSVQVDSRIEAVMVACQSFPLTTRLHPFKNIYCYTCYREHLFFTNHDFSLLHITEKSDISNRNSQLSFTVDIIGKNKTSSLEKIVQDQFSEAFQYVNYPQSSHRKNELFSDIKKLRDIEDMYMSVCGTGNDCGSTRNKTHKVYKSPVCGQCSCESSCAEADTCCPELLFRKAPYSCIDPQDLPTLARKNDVLKIDQRLLFEGSIGRFRVIDTCLAMDGDDILVRKCGVVKDYSDVLTSIPVTVNSGNSYKNIYCYACNRKNTDVFFTFQILCETYIEYDLFLSMHQLLKAIKTFCFKVLFIPLSSRKCKMAYDSFEAGKIGGVKYIRTEKGPFSKTEHVTVSYFDRDKTVKSIYALCNQTGKLTTKESLIDEVCKSTDENILSLPEYRIDDKVYKNFACFMCNPDVELPQTGSSNVTADCLLNYYFLTWHQREDLKELCHESGIHSRWFPYKNVYCAECNLPPWKQVDVKVVYLHEAPFTSAYQHMFTLSQHDFERIILAPKLVDIPQCSSGTFDHSLRKCRPVYCNVGFQLSIDTCVPILEAVSKKEYVVNLELHNLNRESNNTSTNTEENTSKGNISILIAYRDICLQVLTKVEQKFYRTPLNSIMSTCQASESQSPASLTDTYYDIANTKSINLEISFWIGYTENISSILRSLVDAQHNTFHIDNILDSQGINRTIDFLSRIPDRRFNISEDIAPYDVNAYPLLVDNFVLCPHVKFDINKTLLTIETGEIYLTEKNISFEFGEYKLTRGFILVCKENFDRKNLLTQTNQTVSSSTNGIYSVFDFVCSVTSMVCLLLTIATYSIFSSLRTLPGQNLLVLCVLLLCAQSLLQFGLHGSKTSIWCKIAGVSMHFFWIASFCAMNVCSFHMFRVFVFADNWNRLPSRFLFVKYLIYIVTFPLFLVLIAASISLIKSEGSGFGYGENLCFISDFYIFIGTFLVPACAIFIANIAFFATASHKIRTARRVESTQDRNNFYICLKLCAIVGITWPLLIINNIIQETWFGFVVSGVNSLQGLFIFFSFVVNRRVARLYISCFQEISVRQVEKNSTNIKCTNISRDAVRNRCDRNLHTSPLRE